MGRSTESLSTHVSLRLMIDRDYKSLRIIVTLLQGVGAAQIGIGLLVFIAIAMNKAGDFPVPAVVFIGLIAAASSLFWYALAGALKLCISVADGVRLIREQAVKTQG